MATASEIESVGTRYIVELLGRFTRNIKRVGRESEAGLESNVIVTLNGYTDRVDTRTTVDFPVKLFLVRVCPGLNNQLMKKM